VTVQVLYFFLVPPRKCWDNTISTAFFIILSHSSLAQSFCHSMPRTLCFGSMLLSSLKISESYKIVRHSANKEMFWFYRNRSFVTMFNRRPLLESITSQFNEVNIFTLYFSNNRLNVILPLRLCVPSGHFPSGFRTTILNVFLFSPYVVYVPTNSCFSI
jgi:hypothetical protein